MYYSIMAQFKRILGIFSHIYFANYPTEALSLALSLVILLQTRNILGLSLGNLRRTLGTY